MTLGMIEDSDRQKTENDIRLQAQIINQIHDAVISTDLNGCITSWNKGAERLLGYTAKESLGQNISLIFTAKKYTSLYKNEEILRQKIDLFENEVQLRQKSGREFYANLSLSMLRDSRGGIIGMINCLMDISDRKIAENALRESERRFRHIFEYSPIGMNLIDLEGRYVQVNRAMCELLKYSESELKELNFLEITHPEDIPKEAQYQEQIAAEEISSYSLEKRYLTKTGEAIWVNLTAATIRDFDGNVRYGLGMLEDINNRKQSEEALRHSEERFRKIFEEGPLGMAVIGFNQRVLKVNTMLCQMLGYSERELMAQPFNFITHPEDQDADSQLSKQLYYGRISNYQIEKRYIKKDQKTIWITLTASVVRDEHGKTLHSLAMVRDITKRKEDQEKIESSLHEKEVLLKEIHHRVKNNLHVIANLLDLQSQYIEDEKILALFTNSQNRIYSMAMIHEQLYQSSTLSHINFGDYVKSLADNLFISYSVSDVSQKIEIEPIILNIETAIPCGLILNELVSNSLKYAFPAGRSGEISIQFSSLKSDDRDNSAEKLYRMIVSDNGIGIPKHIDWNSTNSLGLRLVRILSRQLEGVVELNCTNGTEFWFTFVELKYKERLNAHDQS
jgi:PAS domain S-box-containing protein